MSESEVESQENIRDSYISYYYSNNEYSSNSALHRSSNFDLPENDQSGHSHAILRDINNNSVEALVDHSRLQGDTNTLLPLMDANATNNTASDHTMVPCGSYYSHRDVVYKQHVARFIVASIVLFLCAVVWLIGLCLPLFNTTVYFVERKQVDVDHYLNGFLGKLVSVSGYNMGISVLVSTYIIILPIITCAALLTSVSTRLLLFTFYYTHNIRKYINLLRISHRVYIHGKAWYSTEVFTVALTVIVRELPAVVNTYGKGKLFFELHLRAGLFCMMLPTLIIFLFSWKLDEWLKIPAFKDKTVQLSGLPSHGVGFCR